MNPEPITEETEQALQNLSFDKDFNVLQVEMLGYDGTNLTRVAVSSDGTLQTA
jgi:hypothetical protein